MTGQCLKEKILLAKVPLSVIAERLGITAQSLNSCFKGKDVRSNTIERIAEVLDVDMSFFYQCSVYHRRCSSRQLRSTKASALPALRTSDAATSTKWYSVLWQSFPTIYQHAASCSSRLSTATTEKLPSMSGKKERVSDYTASPTKQAKPFFISKKSLARVRDKATRE